MTISGWATGTRVKKSATTMTTTPTRSPRISAAGHVAEHDQPVGQRRDQQLLDVLAELRAEEARDDVAVGVADDRHHDEARGDVLHVVEAVHLPDALADEAAEDHEVERRRDGRRHQRLAPDAQDAAVLAAHDGLEADAPDAREGDFSPPRRSTRRMKSSSSRFTLLRMLTHLDALLRQPREDVVEALVARDVDLDRVVVHAASSRSPAAAGRPRSRSGSSARTSPGVELADHAATSCRSR